MLAMNVGKGRGGHTRVECGGSGRFLQRGMKEAHRGSCGMRAC